MSKYPIFIECCEYTLDEHWKTVFLNASIGKFPKGMYMINNDTNLKVGNEIYDISDDPREMTKLCMTIFKKKLKLKSNDDKEKNTNEFKLIQKSREFTHFKEWKDIKPKNLKEKILNDYIINLKIKFGLKRHELFKLNKVVNVGILFKKIKSDNIVYLEGKIVDIDNLNVVETKRGFEFHIDGDIHTDRKTTNTIIIKKCENPYLKDLKSYIIHKNSYTFL